MADSTPKRRRSPADAALTHANSNARFNRGAPKRKPKAMQGLDAYGRGSMPPKPGGTRGTFPAKGGESGSTRPVGGGKIPPAGDPSKRRLPPIPFGTASTSMSANRPLSGFDKLQGNGAGPVGYRRPTAAGAPSPLPKPPGLAKKALGLRSARTLTPKRRSV